MQVDNTAVIALDDDALVLDHVALGVQGDDIGNAEGLARDHEQIAALEQEQAALQSALLDGTLYRDDPKGAVARQARVEEIETLLLEKLGRWEELEAKQAGSQA